LPLAFRPYRAAVSYQQRGKINAFLPNRQTFARFFAISCVDLPFSFHSDAALPFLLPRRNATVRFRKPPKAYFLTI